MPTPLARKLGITAGSRVLLVGAPAGFVVDGLPDGVELQRGTASGAGRYDVIVAFCPDAATLDGHLPALVDALATAGGLWACWPKRASGVASDLSDGLVRDRGLATGLVDNKVAAIDGTWSGLRFVRRLADR